MRSHKQRSRTGRRVRTLDPSRALLLKQALVGLVLFLSVGGLLAGAWYGTRLEAVTITEIVIDGGDTIPHEVVYDAASAALDGTYFYLIPKRFSYLYPAESIASAVTELERVASVTVTQPTRRKLEIQFTEHTPQALWCNGDGDSCVFVTAEGYAFAPAANLTGGVLLRFYDKRGEPEVGTSIFSNDQMDDIEWLVSALEQDIEWGVDVVELDADDRVTVRMTNQSALYVHLSQPVTHTLHYLQSLLRSDEYSHLDDGEFAYIDMRFGNRLFVNQTIVAGVATSTEDTGQLQPVDQEPVRDSTPPAVTEMPTSDDDIGTPTQTGDVTQTSVVEVSDDEEDTSEQVSEEADE